MDERHFEKRAKKTANRFPNRIRRVHIKAAIVEDNRIQLDKQYDVSENEKDREFILRIRKRLFGD